MNITITAVGTIVGGVGLLGLTTIALIKLFRYAQGVVHLRTYLDIIVDYWPGYPSHHPTGGDVLDYETAAPTGAGPRISGSSRDRRAHARRRTGTSD